MIISFNSHLQKILNTFSKNISKYTVPLFLQEKYSLESWGTGILINIYEKYLLLSASHVLRDNINNICIIDQNRTIPLNGKIYYSNLVNNSFEADKTDLSFIIIDHEITNINRILNNKSFINLNNIEIDHIRELGSYFVFGFPSDLCKKDNDKYLSTAMSYFATSLSKDKFDGIYTKNKNENFSYDFNNHIFLTINKKSKSLKNIHDIL